MRTECDNHALTKAPRTRAMLGGSSECWVRACLYSFSLKRKVQWKPQAMFLSLPQAHEHGDHLLPREGLFFRKLLLARCWKKSRRRLGHGATWLRRGFHRPGYKVREFIHSAPLTSFFFPFCLFVCFVHFCLFDWLINVILAFNFFHNDVFLLNPSTCCQSTGGALRICCIPIPHQIWPKWRAGFWNHCEWQ